MKDFNRRVFEAEKGREVTVSELVRECSIEEEDYWSELEKLGSILEEYNLDLHPPLKSGSANTTRVLRKKTNQTDVFEEIADGECHSREFKSTAFTCLQKQENAPGLNPKAYLSKEVTHTAFKTIAAFSNAEGGDLYIGVKDNGNVCGIEKDFSTIGVEDIDGWELQLRGAIRARFQSGKSMLSYVMITYHKKDGKTLAHVRVTARQRLDFVKKDKKEPFKLYLRQGNLTNEVDFHEIEDFYDVSLIS